MLAVVAFCFSLFFSAVLSFPLAQRDVVAPHITNPHAGTVWMVGSQELVTWETDNLPPDSQITNPNGRVILGFQENDSMNLDLDHPLAENFKLRAGNVTITVPDVPPREDYIIVLMGDSGNASPAFAITSIQGGSGSSSGSGTSIPSSSLSANSPPITGNTITGGVTSSTSSGTTRSAPTPASTPTTPIVLPSSEPASVSASVSVSTLSSTSSGSATTAGSAAAAATSTSSAWSVHRYKTWSLIATPLALVLLI